MNIPCLLDLGVRGFGVHYGMEPNPKPQTLNPKPSTTVLGESLGLVLLELTLHCLGVWACGAQGTELSSSEAISEDALTWHHRNEAFFRASKGSCAERSQTPRSTHQKGTYCILSPSSLKRCYCLTRNTEPYSLNIIKQKVMASNIQQYQSE